MKNLHIGVKKNNCLPQLIKNVFFLMLISMAVIMAFSCSGNTAAKSGVVGEPFVSKEMEIVVNKVFKDNQFGEDLFAEVAAENNDFIIIEYSYKNISSETKSALFDVPVLTLRDKKNKEYSSDSLKSGSYLSTIEIDSDLLGDIEPGSTVQNADVFEIESSLLAETGWKLDVDGTIIPISF